MTGDTGAEEDDRRVPDYDEGDVLTCDGLAEWEVVDSDADVFGKSGYELRSVSRDEEETIKKLDFNIWVFWRRVK